MSSLIEAVAALQGAVAAVATVVSAPEGPQLRVDGTAWCASESGMFITAHHVLGGQPQARRFLLRRQAPDSMFALISPVLSVVLEDSEWDVAVLHAPFAQGAKPLPIAIDHVQDGTRVVTCGFPSPQVFGVAFGPNDTPASVQALLSPFANEGIVSGHYRVASARPRAGATVHEFNVSWHHGESGGVIARVEPFAAFAVMQTYRALPTPLGNVQGPRRGYALGALKSELKALGIALG